MNGRMDQPHQYIFIFYNSPEEAKESASNTRFEYLYEVPFFKVLGVSDKRCFDL
jgi:hypothetical protein